MKIKASYTSKCRKCGTFVQVGDECEWTKQDGVTCMACATTPEPVVVTDKLLEGLAAAVEIATDPAEVHIVRRRAKEAMGTAPDLRVGMTFEDALAALTATRKGVGAVATVEPKIEVKLTPVDPDAGTMEVPGHGEVVTAKGLNAAGETVKEILDIAPLKDGAVESKPLDRDEEDDSWLAGW